MKLLQETAALALLGVAMLYALVIAAMALNPGLTTFAADSLPQALAIGMTASVAAFAFACLADRREY